MTAVNGTEYPSDRVFIEALKYIKSQVFKFFTKNKLQIDNIDDIQWILTVPAIWSEKAKYKMEQWAAQAGLINKQIPNHLKIVYEPDCASLSIQYEIQKLKKQKNKKLSIMKASKKSYSALKNDEQKTQEIIQQNSNDNDNDKDKDIDNQQENVEKNVDNNNNDDDSNQIKSEQDKDLNIDKDNNNANEEVDGNDNDNDNNDDNQVKNEQKEENDDKDKDKDNDDDNDNVPDEEPQNEEQQNEEQQNEEQQNEEEQEEQDNDNHPDEPIPNENENENDENDKNDKNDENDKNEEQQEEENNDNDKEKEKEEEEQNKEEQNKEENEQIQENEEKDKEQEIESAMSSRSEMKVEKETDLTNYEEAHMEEHWLKGEKYILIDAGGGTCDVACHEILGDFAVQEIVHPTGGPWGSTYIDDNFIKLLYKIFNKQWIDEFKKEDPAAYTELIDNFRVAKQEFWNSEKGHKDNDDNGDNDGDGDDNDNDENNEIPLSEGISLDEKMSLYKNKWHNVQLPFDFCTFLEEKVEESKEEIEDCDLEQIVEQTEIFEGKTGFITLEDEYLRLNYIVWTTQLFDIVIDPILSHCKYLLSDTIMRDNTSYICLVGGLGSSKYLQYRITSTFGPSSLFGLNIIIPSRPILSVVDGAARFGLQPDYIVARTLSKTYGNAIDPKIDVIDIDALPPGYLEANQYRCDHTNVLRVRNIFSVYARKNQTIHIHDKPIIRKYKRFNIKQKKVRISVYSSDEQDPKVVKNKPCAKTTVVFPPNSTELSIIVELYFSDTKIRVFAYPEDDKDNKKEMELDYEYKV